MEGEFSWMTYFVALFVLVVLSIALNLLCPSRGRRDPTAMPPDDAGHKPGSERAR